MTNNKQSKPKRQSTIKFKDLQKQFNSLNKMSTYVVDDSENKVIKYYNKFDTQKIEELIKELYIHLTYDKENTLNFFENDDNFIKYSFYMILKHFTHFKDEIGSQYETNIAAMNQLISLGYFELCFSEIFDNEEVFKVIDKINQSLELVGKAIDLETRTKEEVASKVQSDVIKKKIIPEV